MARCSAADGCASGCGRRRLRDAHRSAGQQNELVRGEEFIHARAEIGVTLPQRGNFVGREARAPFQAIANRRLEAVEVAGVKPAASDA